MKNQCKKNENYEKNEKNEKHVQYECSRAQAPGQEYPGQAAERQEQDQGPVACIS